VRGVLRSFFCRRRNGREVAGQRKDGWCLSSALTRKGIDTHFVGGKGGLFSGKDGYHYLYSIVGATAYGGIGGTINRLVWIHVWGRGGRGGKNFFLGGKRPYYIQERRLPYFGKGRSTTTGFGYHEGRTLGEDHPWGKKLRATDKNLLGVVLREGEEL